MALLLSPRAAIVGDTPSFTAEVTPPANDGDRAADTVTVTAYSGTVGNSVREGSASFTVADAHALPAPAAVTVEARDAAGGVRRGEHDGGGGRRAEPGRDVQRGGGRAVRGDCPGQHRRLLGLVVRPVGAGIAAARVTEGEEIQLVVTAAPAVTQETVVSLTASPRSFAAQLLLAAFLAAGGYRRFRR